MSELDVEQIRAEARGYADELAEWRRERAALQAERDALRSFAQARSTAEGAGVSQDYTDQDVIRRIARITGDAFCEDLDMRMAFAPDEVSPELKSANEKLALIYRLAHSHDTSARCYRVHDDWRKLMKEKP